MKRTLTICSLVFLYFSLNAQAPQALNYQAIARAANGEPLGNTSLFVKFEIFTNSLGVGQPEFDEEQSATSDPITGLFNLKIGAQDQSSFSNIDWTNGPKYLRVTINGVVGPLTQMLSVPYALYAEKSGNGGQNYIEGPGIDITGNVISNTGDNDNSTTNELQNLQLTGNQLSLVPSGNSVTLPLGTDSQQLSIFGNQISISNGNTITLPPEVDGSTTNELQTLTLNGNTLTLQPGGGSVTLPTSPSGTDDQLLTLNGNVLGIENGNSVTIDANPTNELQTLVLTGNQLSLNPNGGTITLPSINNGGDDQTLSITGNLLSIEDGNTVSLPAYTAGNGISIINNVVTNTGDLSSNNEIQTLTLSGNTLILNPNGGSVTLPTQPGGGSDSQTLSISGNQLSITNGNTVTLPPDDQTLTLTGNQLSIENGNSVNLPPDDQTLTISGNQLSISGGNTVTLPQAGQNYQAGNGININGSVISAVDASIDNELQFLTLSGSFLELSPNGGFVDLSSLGGGYYITGVGGGTPGTTCNNGFLPFYCEECSGNFPSFEVKNVCNGTAVQGTAVSNASENAGVKGIAEGTSGNGVWGECNVGGDAWGVYGTSASGYGVVGWSATSSKADGLFGDRIIVSGAPDPASMAFWNTYNYATFSAFGTSNTSDIRLKKNIESLQYGLSSVMKMKPVAYNWKADTAENSPKSLGFIAQEMEQIIPEVVVRPAANDSEGKPNTEGHANGDVKLSMKYQELIPVLVNAIQEQQAQIEDLKSKLQDKEAQVEQLSAKMDSIEQLLKDLKVSAEK